MNSMLRRRAVTLFLMFTLIFCGLFVHLMNIQVFSSQRLLRQAVSQQSQIVPLEVPSRGKILDRNLRPLVQEYQVWRLLVFPVAMIDKKVIAGHLAAVLELNVDEFSKLLEGKPKILPFSLSAEQVKYLQKQKIPGVIVTKVKLREKKPGLAGHMIGYLGAGEGSEWNGIEGIEAYYDNELKSSVPESLVRIFIDGKGNFIPGLGYKIERNTGIRNNVVTTIDRDIQRIVEMTMDDLGIVDGAVVVMDSSNGDIMAAASRPDYFSSFINKCLSPYQPGSVFKVIVAAAAIEEGLVNAETNFLCIGEKDDIVKCYEKGGHGLITFFDAVTYSCNPTFARVGLKLGAEKLIEYSKRFGLGDSSIIGYRGSNYQKGLEAIAEKYNLVNASLGQWPVEASVVQITAMMATIANDGVYNTPRIVREIKNSEGKTVNSFLNSKGVQVISLNTAKTVQSMLKSVTKIGTGKQAMVGEWGSAGKTGSAQVGSQKIDAWFSGYAPIEKPRYVVTVLVNNGESGGKTAAPVFKEIMQKILEHEEITVSQ